MVCDLGAWLAITDGKGIAKGHVNQTVSFNTQGLSNGRGACSLSTENLITMFWYSVSWEEWSKDGKKDTLARLYSGKIVLSFLSQTLFCSFDLPSRDSLTIFLKRCSLFQNQKCFCGLQPVTSCNKPFSLVALHAVLVPKHLTVLLTLFLYSVETWCAYLITFQVRPSPLPGVTVNKPGNWSVVMS